MTQFVCDKCDCIDLVELANPPLKGGAMLCSACQPRGKWHGQFEQRKYNPEYDQPVNRDTGIGLS